MKFIDCKQSKDKKTTIVVMEHKDKLFIGKAKVHPDDEKFASTFVGGELAELRAIIKALKYEYSLKKQECENYRKFIRMCSNYKNFDKTSPTAKVMFRELNHQIKNINKFADFINSFYVKIENKKLGQNKLHKIIEEKSKQVNDN